MPTTKTYLTLLVFSYLITITAQNTKKEDQKAIKAMCGCFEVQFNFVETFKYPTDSSSYKASATKYEKALEWVELVEEHADKMVLQHLLITEDAIIKHWRQDWLYQNTDFYLFFKDNNWKFKQLSPEAVKGQWTQKVYQVDDSPRYEGSSSWAHIDAKKYWLNSSDAPLPRREHTKRNDYNVLKRRNIHQITDTGWIHEQDNQKLLRDPQGNDRLVAVEKGMNHYLKVADSNCIRAKNWWLSNKKLWQRVRNKWERVYQEKKELSLQSKVRNKTLYSVLFELAPTASQQQIDAIIDSYIITEKKR